MEISMLQDDYEKWDRYVKRSTTSTFFHQVGWKNVVERTFGHQPYYLYAERNNEICGILPLFLINSRLFGKFLVSLPYAVYGGICADDDDIENLLIEEALKIAVEENVKYIEFRNIKKNGHPFPYNDLYVTFRSELPHSSDECLKNLPKDARRGVRKAFEYGLEIEIDKDKLKEFYHLFAITMKNLGSPVYPFSLIKNIVNEFHDQLEIFHVKFQGRIVACGMVFFFNNAPIGFYGGSLKEYRYYYINNFLYFKVMEYAIEKKYKYMDFGRSRKGTGTYNFKKHWGVKPQPLYYQYYLNRAKEVPQTNPSNPKFDIPKKIWQGLPLSLTKLIGPMITKNLP